MRSRANVLIRVHNSSVHSVAFSPLGHRVASGGSDNTARLWDLRSCREEVTKLTGHNFAVSSVRFSTDGLCLFSGSWDRTIRICDVEICCPIGVLTGSNAVSTVETSPDGRSLVSCGYDMTVRLWDSRTRENTRTFRGHTSSVYSVDFSPDGRTVASGALDGTLRLWDVGSGTPLKKITPFVRVWSVAYSPDGATVAAGIEKDGEVVLYDSASGALMYSVAFSSNRFLATGSKDSKVRLWDLESGKCVRELIGHRDTVRSLDFSKGGAQLVSCSHDKTVRVWDI